MPKLDFSTIENWDTMSPEERVAALENFEYDDNSTVIETLTKDRDRYKNAVTKTSSEIAELKRQSKAALSAEEQKALDAAEELETLRSQVADLQRAKQVATFVAKGYSEELALEKFEALASGDFDKVLAVDEKFLTQYKKNIEKELTNATPPPASGSSAKKMTREDFRKLSPQERFDFSKKDPDTYKALYGGE